MKIALGFLVLLVAWQCDAKLIKCTDSYFGERDMVINTKAVHHKWNFKGNNTITHIENVNKLNEANDYVEIKDAKYSVTYALKCEVVSD